MIWVVVEVEVEVVVVFIAAAVVMMACVVIVTFRFPSALLFSPHPLLLKKTWQWR